MKRVLLSIPFLLLGCSDPNPPQQEVNKPVNVASNGQAIYMLYCASCHGQTGNGKGLIELDRPARSFIDGGFSFGNTVHAISKTTASGIPGTPMPPFVDVLSAEDINSVSKFVRDFAPTREEATPDETEMVVLNRPLIVRGMIPPLHEGLQLHPRGLVVGNPDRFSYEYRVDDVRLLAVRQGLFVQRADWGERGGSPLTLLGGIVVDVDNGDPKGMFTLKDNIPLHAKLLSTVALGEYGIVKYTLVTPDGKTVATVEEYCSPTTGTRTLIKQHISIDSSEDIIIHPPSNTDVSSAPFIPAGKHEFIITHALYGGES